MKGRAAPAPGIAISSWSAVATPVMPNSYRRTGKQVMRPVRQHGQALVLVLVLMVVGGVAWVALYNIGRTTSARVRLTHVADAVAYSGAVEQARSLNTLAYINRAQVAHQVAMAHLATLSSWAQYEHTQSQQRHSRNPPSSLIRRLFGAAAGRSYTQARSIDDVMPALARAFQEHDDVVHQVLQQASVSVAADLADMRGQTMLRVLQANYPEYDQGEIDPDPVSPHRRGPFMLALLADGATGYVRRYSGRDAGRLRHTVEQAAGRYDFLRRRDQTHRNDWIVHSPCPIKRHELRRRGRTWLADDGRWSAQDSVSFHALRNNRWIGCHYREYPMGWGQNSHEPDSDPGSSNPPYAFAQQDFWRWVHEHTAWDLVSGQSNPLAKAYASSNAVQWSGRGLPGYYDLTAKAARQPLRFAIELRQSAASLSMNDAGTSRRRFAYGALSADEFMAVRSAAQTYFAPPSQQDGNNALATLFRPYWQARLSPLRPEDRSGARP